MKTTRAGILATLAVLAVFVAHQPLAVGCERSGTLANYDPNGPWLVGQQDITKIEGYYFVPGQGDVRLQNGRDNGAQLPKAGLARDWIYEAAQGNFYVFGDWANGGTDLCADPFTDPISVVLVEPVAEATPSHSLSFLMATVSYDFARTGWNYDHSGLAGGRITNGVPTMQPVPQPQVLARPQSDGSLAFDLSWSAPVNGAEGYSDQADYGKILDSYRVFAWVDSSNADGIDAPQTGEIQSCSSLGSCWFEVGSANASLQGTLITGLPVDLERNSVWFALSPVFADGFSVGYVGRQGEVSGPATQVFQSVTAVRRDARRADVTWSVSGAPVTQFNVFWSSSLNGTFVAVGKSIVATTGTTSYTRQYKLPLSPQHHFKVKAVLPDGSVQWSAVATLAPQTGR